MVFLRPPGIARWALLALSLVVGGCTGVFFQPMRAHVQSPDDLGLVWRDVWFRTEDGILLHGWFLPAQGQSRGTVLFLHGNAQNISTHIGAVAWLPASGFSVFLFDYRGYGWSDGAPDLDGLHRDVDAALGTVLGHDAATPEGVDPQKVAVFGQSLGGSIAITALARSPWRGEVRGLIVEGAFADYRRIAREVLSRTWLTWPLQWPLSLLVDDRRSPEEEIAKIAPVPLLIIQGEADAIVAPAHAQDLWAAAGPPKALWLIPDAGHVGALADPNVRRRFADWLRLNLRYADSGASRPPIPE